MKYLFVCVALLLSGLSSAENLRVIAEDDWFPYSAEIKGKPSGLSVDLVKAAYNAVGTPINMITLPYARCMKLLEAGKEPVCFDTSKDSATLPKYLFSDEPLYIARIAIYAKTGRFSAQNIGLSDLIGRKIGLTNGYTYGDAVEQSTSMLKDYSNSDLHSLRKLAIGRVDYVLAYDQVATYLINMHKEELAGKIKPVGLALEVPIYVTFSATHLKGRFAKDMFDQGFALIKRNGTYSQIMQKWQAATPTN
ncbi:transporter substrate-binding domain-containing protein [Leeia sp. TBRC 13508]|uniref:Transporter substrate-binding domain-containing protein n=1 Tax=Leeia speluncae TaxID=2884804 RepID=A0ABS8D4E8_9NEIS|nr:transporter substrate-binding domain-containing protein [Leeia speluncae]MCB6183091.1 transporter substrate-binding domain-containing protein [Leeia speluncae]